MLKYGVGLCFNIEDYFKKCIKGDWSSCFFVIECFFGVLFDDMCEKYSVFEEIWNIWNCFGYVFGRDIEVLREYG